MAWDTRISLTQLCRRVSLAVVVLMAIVTTQSQPATGQYRDGYYSRNDKKPRFRPTMNNITTSPGDRAVLKCKVENLGTKTVTWRRQGEIHPLTIGLYTFAPDTRINVDFNQRTNEWSLIIQAVKPTDEGVYECLISTKDESTKTYDVLLNVRTVQVTGTEYVERGGMVRLVCNASGRPDPPHNVDWYKDGEKIESDAVGGVIITKKIGTKQLVSMLVIQDTDMTDAGDYICRSSNKDAGMIQVRILNVQSPVGKRDFMSQMQQLDKPRQGTSTGEARSGATAVTLHNNQSRSSLLTTFGSLLAMMVLFYDTRWRLTS